MHRQWSTLEVESSGSVTVVTLSRPSIGNPVDDALRDELPRLWSALVDRADVTSVLLASRGAAFSVGFSTRDATSPTALEEMPAPFGPRSCGFRRPIVVELGGDVGAGAFALIGEADFVLAADDIQFFVPLGSGPAGARDVTSLNTRLPIFEVNRLALLGFGNSLSALRARQLGLIDEIVERPVLRARALALAEAAGDAAHG